MQDIHPQAMIALDLPNTSGAKAFLLGAPGVKIRTDGALDLCLDTLTAEMEQLQRLDVSLLIGLVEDEELGAVSYEDVHDAATEAGIGLLRFPIPDFAAPRAERDGEWSMILARIETEIAAGHSVALHCLAGIGRSSMMAGSLLVHMGLAPDEAITRVRAVLPGAFETGDQLAHLFR